MKTAFLLLAFFLGAVSALRAGEGKLEIRAVATQAGPPASAYLFDDEDRPETLYLEPEVLLDTTSLVSAEAINETQGWVILVVLSADGKKRFGEVTAKFLNRRLAILINDRVRSAPILRTTILDGRFEISGAFDEGEVKKLATDLNTAAQR